MLTANEVHREGMRVRMTHSRTAFIAADELDKVSVYIGCRECGRMDDGQEMPLEEVVNYINSKPCCH